ncbi:polysaccharide pyruvyl transferase CsaB [Actinopolymorpha sp. B9G3]|uniref:polysaccharide pyruvyl transferase CsaB n=1 Tax=Actinopolymorpha sp. B9G3 TaxID=3158970 RepID=UPI0032D92431
MRLLLLGYFGFGNAGDEAILEAEVAALRDTLGADTEFVVVSGDPAYTVSTHGLPAISRTDATGVVRALRTCDALVAGGGSLLQDVTSARPVPFYAGLMLMARALRKPVFVYAQGLGPLHLPVNRLLTAAALKSATYVALRDHDSLILAERLGVRGAEPAADPVLGLDHSAPGADPSGLAVSLRPWRGSATWLPVIRSALATLARDVHVALVPYHARQDVVLARELSADLGGLRVVEPDQGHRAAVEAVAGARAVLGMRLHALLVAAAAGRPFVALSYDPKVTAFAAQVGQPVAATLPGPIDQAALVTSVRKALEDSPDRLYLDHIAALRTTATRPSDAIARHFRER